MNEPRKNPIDMTMAELAQEIDEADTTSREWLSVNWDRFHEVAMTYTIRVAQAQHERLAAMEQRHTRQATLLIVVLVTLLLITAGVALLLHIEVTTR